MRCIMLEKLSENIFDKVSIDFLRNQVLKNAYGNNDTVIAALDPRILLLWYLFFGLVPWFMDDVVLLLGMFLWWQPLPEWRRSRPWSCFCSVWGYLPRPDICFLFAVFRRKWGDGGFSSDHDP